MRLTYHASHFYRHRYRDNSVNSNFTLSIGTTTQTYIHAYSHSYLPPIKFIWTRDKWWSTCNCDRVTHRIQITHTPQSIENYHNCELLRMISDSPHFFCCITFETAQKCEAFANLSTGCYQCEPCDYIPMQVRTNLKCTTRDEQFKFYFLHTHTHGRSYQCEPNNVYNYFQLVGI